MRSGDPARNSSGSVAPVVLAGRRVRRVVVGVVLRFLHGQELHRGYAEAGQVGALSAAPA